ncbi:MAG: alanine racemase [Actinomycetota bacterium]
MARVVADLSTPALIVDDAVLGANLARMARTRPGATLRPHVKAHKCTSLARLQADHGHHAFTCATAGEVAGMARAGLGFDLLLANECVDPQRLSELARLQDEARITIAVDSPETIAAAVRAGLHSVVIDVNVGLPRCGCDPQDAGHLADLARADGLYVRGVMGYEGHLMALPDDDSKRRQVHDSMKTLVDAFDSLRDGPDCDVISAGGTGTFHLFEGDDTVARITEVQAGSYVLMDSHYGALGLPFGQALFVVGTVISSQRSWAVIDVGLKALGMDHGPPTIPGATVWFCSDEHTTFSVDHGPRPKVGDRALVVPAHVDPTVAMHGSIWRVSSAHPEGEVLEEWAVDLRGWSTR